MRAARSCRCRSVAVVIRCRSSVRATVRSSRAEVISTAWLGTTRMYARLNQHDRRSFQGPSSHHHVVVDAVALGFLERGIGDLVHADGARGRLVELERIPRQPPPPVRPRHRVAGALDLRQGGQQIRRHGGRGVLAEERPVAAPGLAGVLDKRTADREEQLGRLADDLVRPVQRPPQPDDDHAGEEEPERQGDRQQATSTRRIECPRRRPRAVRARRAGVRRGATLTALAWAMAECP